MNPTRKILSATARHLLAMVCVFSLLPGDAFAYTADIRVARATSPSGELTPDHFDRYRILPCEFLNADTRATAALTTTDSEMKTAASSACQSTLEPKYHLAIDLRLASSNAGTLSAAPVSTSPNDGLVFDSAPIPKQNPFLIAVEQDKPPLEREGFHWFSALQQSFNFLLIEHAFRIATDPFLRYLLWHKPFWHDYLASTKHFYFNRWGDGDDFIVNYIGHPLEGGVTGNIQILNDPRGRSLKFGKSGEYWKSRLRAMAWAAVYSAQFEAGPILSEAAIGNEGGYFYKPGCHQLISCSTPNKTPVTNNTGWVDFVVTPTIGIGWILLEDSIEAEFTDRWDPQTPDAPLRFKLWRASLSPSHVMANFVAGKVPWYRYRIYGPDGGSLFNWRNNDPPPKFSFDGVQRWEAGVHYSLLSLPVDTETCTSCRVNNSGFGVNLAYRITNRLWVDSDVNYFPGGGSFANKGSLTQGMFGPRYGYTGRNWGWYFKLRPGFIYYDKTHTLDSGTAFTNATRFAFDVGSVFEWFTTRHSTLRVDAGTTVLRYLTTHDDPRQPVGFLSTDYYASQSNFQISAGYSYRF
jgi:hypothetical protein